MPIFHLSIRTHSRSAGRSAVAAAAYRAGVRLRCDRTGRIHDYSRRHGIMATRIVVPQSETTIDRQALWDRAEAAERRSNSTVAREIEVALPHELDAAARETLALGFAKALATRYGIAVDVAVHAPSGKGDDRNHHVHYLTSTRVWTAGAFGRKVRQLDDRRTGPAEVTAIREMWAGMCNAALAREGMTDRVDPRSHVERGLDKVPGRKLGVGASGFEARTRVSSRRRSDHETDALADTRMTQSRDERAGPGRGEADLADRRERLRAVLGHLRRQFTAATRVVVSGARSPTIERAVARPGRIPSIARSRSALGATTHVVLPTGGPAAKAGNRKRRHHDEAAEAAALYRRVDRELDAEHMARVAQDKAEAERAASRVAHADRSVFAASTDHHKPVPTPFCNGSRKCPGVVAPGPVRPVARHEKHVGRSPHRSSDLRQDVQRRDEPMPAAAAVVTQGGDLRGLTLMMARELERRHKRSRTRLARLTEAAGLDEEVFERTAAVETGEEFDLAAIRAEPALAELWNAWMREDREKQAQSRQGREDDKPLPPVLDEAPEADGRRNQDGVVDGPADIENEAEDAPVAARQITLSYRRRDAVIDMAILVIARGSWTPAIGDALAEELGTRRGWIWAEALRVCRDREERGNPRALPAEKREEMRRRARRGAARWPNLLRNLDMIHAGKIPPSRKR